MRLWVPIVPFYYVEEEAGDYHCPNCNADYKSERHHLSCSVTHSAGECCHKGETLVKAYADDE